MIKSQEIIVDNAIKKVVSFAQSCDNIFRIEVYGSAAIQTDKPSNDLDLAIIVNKTCEACNYLNNCICSDSNYEKNLITDINSECTRGFYSLFELVKDSSDILLDLKIIGKNNFSKERGITGDFVDTMTSEGWEFQTFCSESSNFFQGSRVVYEKTLSV